MEVGAALRKPAAQAWIVATEDTMALLGGIQAIINPEQYSAGIACIEAVANRQQDIAKAENLPELLETWSAPFNVISVMNNRDTPLHRDNGGGYSTMDLLILVGDFKSCRFSAPGLGVEFWNRSGSVIALAGRVVQHGAKAEGERLCVAMYSRETVFTAFNIPEPQWTSVEDLISNLHNN